MKPPTNCPICNKTMLNECFDDLAGTPFINKRCISTTHSIYISVRADLDKVHLISLYINKVWVYFDYMFFDIKIMQSNKKSILIPWFEPNFSKLSVLKNKIKSYIIFS